MCDNPSFQENTIHTCLKNKKNLDLLYRVSRDGWCLTDFVTVTTGVPPSPSSSSTRVVMSLVVTLTYCGYHMDGTCHLQMYLYLCYSIQWSDPVKMSVVHVQYLIQDHSWCGSSFKNPMDSWGTIHYKDLDHVHHTCPHRERSLRTIWTGLETEYLEIFNLCTSQSLSCACSQYGVVTTPYWEL